MSREKSVKDQAASNKPVIDIGIIKAAPADHYKSIKLEKSPTLSTAAPKVYFGGANSSQANLINTNNYESKPSLGYQSQLPSYQSQNQSQLNQIPTYQSQLTSYQSQFSYQTQTQTNQRPTYQPSQLQTQLPYQPFNKNQFNPAATTTPVYEAKTYTPSDFTSNPTDFTFQKFKY